MYQAGSENNVLNINSVGYVKTGITQEYRLLQKELYNFKSL
jgi:hypothetical protein